VLLVFIVPETLPPMISIKANTAPDETFTLSELMTTLSLAVGTVCGFELVRLN
jgi:hypothetical protein